LASPVQEELGNCNIAYEDKCIVLHLDAKSQRQILEITVNFQGKNVAVDTLVGTNIPECIEIPVDTDVISVMLSDGHKLCVGRQLSDIFQYYKCVLRVLQHHILYIYRMTF
jgi:hypothetical protein